MRRVGRILALGAFFALASAAPASAASVTVKTECVPDYEGGTCTKVTHVIYTAAPGEQNDLTASYRNGRVTFSDRVPIAAPSKCRRDSPTKVSCAGTANSADLGDLDDMGTATNHLTTSGGGVTLDGGAGDDTLTGQGAVISGGPGNDRLTGTSASGDDGTDLLIGTGGGDLLYGGPGSDEIHGGGGNDRLDGDNGPTGSETATDLIDGGPGSDVVSYFSRVTPVEVDLSAGIGGAPGEGDVLQSIENAVGGAAGDRLVGDAAANYLDGGLNCGYSADSAGDLVIGGSGDDIVAGGCRGSRIYGQDGDDRVLGSADADLLDGGPGNDAMEGGFGVDDYQGGPGADTIAPNNPDEHDTISCGAGPDLVDGPGFALLRPDCETVRRVYTRARPYPRRPTARELEFTVRCRIAGRFCSARVRLKILGRPRAIAIGRFSARNGVLRPHFRLPRWVARMQKSPLPMWVIVEKGFQRQPGTDDFDIRWVFDLSATPVG